VLLLEDEALIAYQFEAILTDAGCTVVGPMGTVREALRRLETEKVDVGLLDVMLWDQPVFVLADALAARGIPFVLVTGYAADLPERFRGHPICYKPCSEYQLIGALSLALGEPASAV
jgi:CheY-like chemotaxis protein